jgi:hypothetical protein
MQEQEHECLYVDEVHYNASFAKKLADMICRLCLQRHLSFEPFMMERGRKALLVLVVPQRGD